jgi:predicted DNA-binding antitoxin AbrB/MazE fold protein
MYQAIEAISKGGVIQPLEPVSFEENEHLVIVRLSKTYTPAATPTSRSGGDWADWVGVLKDSPHLNGDPLALQQDMRREWD